MGGFLEFLRDEMRGTFDIVSIIENRISQNMIKLLRTMMLINGKRDIKAVSLLDFSHVSDLVPALNGYVQLGLKK